MTDVQKFDVIVCGGGLSALLLTRQLQVDHPDLAVLILDGAAPRAVDSIQKAGESTLEGASYHLRHTLGLADYLFRNQIPKFGLRFFFKGREERFSDRLEYGGVQWPPLATFQLDRGLFEDELRRLAIAGGATVLCGHHIRRIDLAHRSSSGSDNDTHRVSGTCGGTEFVYRARWLIDATGRRRLMASRLGLTKKSAHAVSASWWWVDGKVDVKELVPAEDSDWHRRVGPPRWHSTVHLTGEGYWIWVIPLASGKTSIGIVSDSSHPVADRASIDGALAWLREHEPQFAELIADRAPLEHRVLRDFSYSSSQVFSEHRWASVGDAAVLTDPLYSFGIDLMCHGSSIVSMLIGLDGSHQLTAAAVAEANRFFLTMFDVIETQYLGTYRAFGSSALYTQKLAWDSSMYFAVLQQTLMQNMYDDPELIAVTTDVIHRLLALNRSMQRLFIESCDSTGPLHCIRGMRTWAPRVTTLADASLDKCVAGQFPEFLRRRLAYLEEIAAAVFVEVARLSPSVGPSDWARLIEAKTGIDPYAASLDPSRWCDDGVFDPTRARNTLDVPVQFDAARRTDAEKRDYVPLHCSLLHAAAQNPNRPAIVDAGRRVALGELVEAAASNAVVPGGSANGVVEFGVADFTDGVVLRLAALAAGQPFAERLTVDATLTGITGLGAVGTTNLAAAEVKTLAGVTPEDVAFIQVDLSGSGAREVPYTHVQLFRMASWLVRLLQSPADDSVSGTCLWVGPPRVEVLIALLAGLTVVTEAQWRMNYAGGGEPEAGAVVMGRPTDLATAFRSKLNPVGSAIFSIGDPLPRSLSRALRSKARRVCDFGYASFSHAVWDPYADRAERRHAP